MNGSFQGLCGSYTTYSGWNLRVARAGLGQINGAASGAIATVVAIATSLAFFAACFAAGSDLVKEIDRRGRTLRLRGMLGGGGLDLGDVRGALGMLGAVYVLLAILLAVDDNWSRRIDWVACMFAPFGALLRFFLSRQDFSRLVSRSRRSCILQRIRISDAVITCDLDEGGGRFLIGTFLRHAP